MACHSPAKTGAHLLEYSTAFVSRRGLSGLQALSRMWDQKRAQATSAFLGVTQR